MVSIRIIRLRYLLFLAGIWLALTAFALQQKGVYLDFTIDRKNFVDTISLNYRYGQILLAVAIDGMRMGDTITEVDGKKMDNFCMFVAEVNAKKRTYKFSLLSEEGVKKEIVYERP